MASIQGFEGPVIWDAWHTFYLDRSKHYHAVLEVRTCFVQPHSSG